MSMSLGSGEAKMWLLEGDPFQFFCYRFKIWMKKEKKLKKKVAVKRKKSFKAFGFLHFI